MFFHFLKIKITVKLQNLLNLEVTELTRTIDSAKAMLHANYKRYSNAVDRFILPEFDYLTVLYRVVSPSQQTAMYNCILKMFADTMYIHNLKVISSRTLNLSSA